MKNEGAGNMPEPLFIPVGEPAPEIPAGWRPFVRLEDGCVRIVGDRSAATPLYLRQLPGGVWLDSDPGRLLAVPAAHGERPAISAEAVCAGLGYCVIPAPLTVYDGVLVAAIGDVFEISPRPGKPLVHRVDFPYFRARSRQDSRPDPAMLKNLLTRSVARGLAGKSAALLLLSSGKDSTGALLALAEAGAGQARAVTFAQDPDDDEAAVARAMCRRFGVPHDVAAVDFSPAGFRALLERFFVSSPEPCLDFTLIPYLAAVALGGAPGGAVLDGTGGDIYFGIPPRGVDRLTDMVPKPPLWLAAPAQSLLPSESRLNHALFSRAENCLYGPKLRSCDRAAFFPASDDIERRLSDVSRAGRGLDGMDFRALMLRHFDGRRVMLKGRTVAPCFSMTAVFPYADAELADYCFHLPEADRFTRWPRRNKLLLRRMLAQYADYDADRIGKRIFAFDARPTLRTHRPFISGEICACSWWRPAQAEAFVRRAYDDLDRRPHAQHHLMRLFLLSGWLNRHAAAAL